MLNTAGLFLAHDDPKGNLGDCFFQNSFTFGVPPPLCGEEQTCQHAPSRSHREGDRERFTRTHEEEVLLAAVLTQPLKSAANYELSLGALRTWGPPDFSGNVPLPRSEN